MCKYEFVNFRPWVAHQLKLLREEYLPIFSRVRTAPKMPLNIDPEHNIDNEETPLLREEYNDGMEGCEQLDVREHENNRFRTTAWTIVFIGIALLFVKGWRDGGKDVNVSF